MCTPHSICLATGLNRLSNELDNALAKIDWPVYISEHCLTMIILYRYHLVHSNKIMFLVTHSHVFIRNSPKILLLLCSIICSIMHLDWGVPALSQPARVKGSWLSRSYKSCVFMPTKQYQHGTRVHSKKAFWKANYSGWRSWDHLQCIIMLNKYITFYAFIIQNNNNY